MTHSIGGRLKATLALAGAALTLCLVLLMSGAPQAEAGQSNYCYNQTWGGYQTCYGAPRNLNAVYGQGTYHSVCVGAKPDATFGCSSGPAPAAVYVPMGSLAYRTPWIQNNAAGSNVLYGIAFWP